MNYIIFLHSGRKRAVEMLIQKGADIHYKNDDGRTALFLAAFTGEIPTLIL